MSQSYASVDPAGSGGIVIVLAKVNAQGLCAKIRNSFAAGTVERQGSLLQVGQLGTDGTRVVQMGLL